VRAYLGFMWGHPGKKLLFMGQEFAQREEWSHEHGLPWHLLDHSSHRGVQHWVRDLNKMYRAQAALHQLDCEASGFQWLVMDDRDNSVLAFARFAAPSSSSASDRTDPSSSSASDTCVIVVCNFTPVPRHGYRVPLPDGVVALQELLNSDSEHYGGSNLGNGPQQLHAEAIGSHGRTHSVAITIPPLATVFFSAMR
jgi:1,4-alpha-glucan branching enzyme